MKLREKLGHALALRGYPPLFTSSFWGKNGTGAWRNTYLVTFPSNGRLAVQLNTMLLALRQGQRREVWDEIEEGLQRLEGPRVSCPL